MLLNMHTTVHSAEFYGAGRLVRDSDGAQWRFVGVHGVVDYMLRNKQESALVMIPIEFEKQLTTSELVKATVLDQSGEISIVAVSLFETEGIYEN